MGAGNPSPAGTFIADASPDSGPSVEGAAEDLIIGERGKTFLTYKGQEVEATKVNYISGRISTSTVDCEGDEDLFRDKRGRYYLRRTLTHWDADCEDRRTSGRTLTHRINVNAAILWATTRLNSETLDLRCDAAALLMENRGYTDPHPLNLNAAKRKDEADAPVCIMEGPLSSVTTPGWFDGCIQPEEGSGARVRTIFDLDPLHAALLKMFTERHGLNVAVLTRAALIQQLRFVYSGADSEEEKATVLCFQKYGHINPPASEDEIAHMRAVVGMEQNTVTPEPRMASAVTTEKSEASTTDEGAYQLTFETAPDTSTCGLRRTVEVPADKLAEVDALAATFDLPRAEFVRLMAERELPGQPWTHASPLAPLGETLKIEHGNFEGLDDDTWSRINRAATVAGDSMSEFISKAVGDRVDCYEENMIVHPQTGQLLCADDDDLYERVDHEITAAPVGQENDPRWRMNTNRRHVELSVWLTPEQMERVEFPHMVYNAATDTDVPCALIPLDPEGNIFMRVDGKEVKPGEPIRKAEVRGQALPVMQLEIPPIW